MDSQFGPLDAVRIVFDDKFCFKMYIFMELLEEGSLPDVESVANFSILQKFSGNSI